MSAARPTIERPDPICNDVFQAFDDMTCSAERLRTLFDTTTGGLYEAIERVPDGKGKDRLFQVWMIFSLAVEKFTELEADLGATQNAFLAVRRGDRAPTGDRS